MSHMRIGLLSVYLFYFLSVCVGIKDAVFVWFAKRLNKTVVRLVNA